MKFTNTKLRLVKKRSLTLMLLLSYLFSFTALLTQMLPIQEVKAHPDDLLYHVEGSVYTIENNYIKITHDNSTGYTDIFRLDAGIVAIKNTYPKINYTMDTYFEASPTVVADDNQMDFWSVKCSYSGSYDLSISDDLTTKVKGVNSLKYQIGAGTYGRVAIQHAYAASQDWSTKDHIGFYWFGTNSGQSDILISLYAPDANNQFQYSWNDNWMGWKRLDIPFREMNKIGNTELSKITFIEIRLWPIAQTTYYLDHLVIDVGYGARVPLFNVATSASITRRENSVILNATYTNEDDRITLAFNLTVHKRFFLVKAVYTNLNETNAKAIEMLSPIISDSAKPAGEIERTLLYSPKESILPSVTDQDFSWVNGNKMESFSLIAAAYNTPVMLMMNKIDKLVFLAAPVTDAVWTPHLALQRASPVYGFSSLQLNCYSHVNLKIPIIVNPNGKIETETFLVGFYEDINDATISYKAVLSEYNDFLTQQPYLMFGTWRTYGSDVNETNVKALADYLNETWLPYHKNIVLEIDDGWQKDVGDWESNPIKFPNGLDSVVSYIKSKGLKIGIWLALYLTTATSQLYASHPEWVLRDTDGQPVEGGVGQQFYLDPTNPNVKNWVKVTLQNLSAMGFTLFKIDHWVGFDVISHAINFYQSNTTLVEARNVMLQTVYETLKEHRDAIIHQTFSRNPLILRFAQTIYLYDFPVTENNFRIMLRGTFESMFSPMPQATKIFDYVLTNRYGLVGKFLGDNHIRLMMTSEFVSGGIIILGGPMIANTTRISMFGSLIPTFTPQSVKLIDISNDTQMYEINYQRDSLTWKYLALLNLNTTKAKSFNSILEKEYLAYEIFTQKSMGTVQNINIEVPPLDARVVVLVTAEKPTMLTTSRHIVNIPELMPNISFNFQSTPALLTAALQIPSGATATIYVPFAIRQAFIDGNPYMLKLISANLYEFKAKEPGAIEIDAYFDQPKITSLTSQKQTYRTLETVELSLTLYGDYNGSGSIKWLVQVVVTDQNGSMVQSIDEEVELNKDQTIPLNFTIGKLKKGFYTVEATIRDSNKTTNVLQASCLTIEIVEAPVAQMPEIMPWLSYISAFFIVAAIVVFAYPYIKYTRKFAHSNHAAFSLYRQSN